jgi:hypothetical protein
MVRIMSRRNKKYDFTLIDIDVTKIHLVYGIKPEQELLSNDNKPITNVTKISELNAVKGQPELVSFLDESKKVHNCHVSMIDFNSKKEVNLLRYHCFWCRNPFDTHPIGCPVRYIANRIEKRYHSQITRDIYTIKENITHKKREIILQNIEKEKQERKEPLNSENEETKEQIGVKLAEIYETDGVFCSFNCCQAWILDNKTNPLYSLSTMLLAKMYNSIMGTKNASIPPAPHWRILKQYGGHLNILKFREGFNKVDYKSHGCIASIPKCISMGILYEENIKF